MGLITGSKGPETNTVLLKLMSIFVLRNEGYSMRETEDLVPRCVLLPSQNSINCL